jgi:hypothetical protein
MSDYLSSDEVQSKLSIVGNLKPQEGKTYVCLCKIVKSPSSVINIVITMNTLSANMQFFGRMEIELGSKNIIVFNSKKETAGDCLHAESVTEVFSLILHNPNVRAIVCCAHVTRIKKSIVELIQLTSDSISFTRSKRSFAIHIDEAHAYIPSNRDSVTKYNNSPVVNSIIGYSATAEGIWTTDRNDPLFYKIFICDVEEELNIIRSPDYFGVNCCDFHILEEEMSHNEIPSYSNNMSQPALVRSESKESFLYDHSFPFSLGDEILLLSYISQIIPRLRISADSFSYHFVPGYTRKATHYEIVEILLKFFPNANVICVNGNGYELYRIHPYDNKSYRVKVGNQILQMVSREERKRLGEPSNMVQELIKDTPNCPTFVTGFTCVGMSVTLVNENLGNFDSVIMAHHHYSRAKLYQLCRFLFNYTKWSADGRSKIKKTQFYSLTKSVVDTCLEYEQEVENLYNEFSGRSCTLREIQGLEPEEPSERERKTEALKKIKTLNEDEKYWKKYKVYDGNDRKRWKKVEKFYERIMNKPLTETSKSRPKKINGFFHCSTTTGVEKKHDSEIKKLEKQSWWSTLQLTQKLSYARIFVGYENLDDPTEYTIYIKYVQLEDSEYTRNILQKYGKPSNSAA